MSLPPARDTASGPRGAAELPIAVIDSSALVAILLDGGPSGQWASDRATGHHLTGPALLPFETANIIRRHASAGIISSDQAAQAHADLTDLPIEYWPYSAVATRVWELRENLTSYDASYGALAELLPATLITLDERIRRAGVLRCEIATPAGSS